MNEHVDLKRLRLRYAGTCRDCGAELPRGTHALWDQTQLEADLGAYFAYRDPAIGFSADSIMALKANR